MHIRAQIGLGFGALHLAASSATEPNGTFVVPWSTDRDPKAVYGHDGPWPAIDVPFGETVEPMLPDPRYMTLVTGKAAGGSYDPGTSRDAVPLVGYTEPSNDFIPGYFFNSSFEGQGFFEVLDIPVRPPATTTDRPTTYISHNATLAVATHWSNNKTQPPEIGILGLGKRNQPRMPDGELALSLLDVMHRNRTLASNTYSLHLGSAALGQRGSFVLGGYDAKRIVGDVGLFQQGSNVWLVDVQLGVAGLGASPFADTGDSVGPHGAVSVFRGDGGNAQAETARASRDGPDGAVFALLDTSLPSLYLPLGTCEAAAQRLPVRWHAELERYLWDTTDPRYGRLIASPAYLAFVLRTGGPQNTNVTIKVPLALLNLTLTRPAAADGPGGGGGTESFAYFPCQPFDSPHGVWLLGRAFLQAAFVLYDLDGALMWVAQAPGPDMTALGGGGGGPDGPTTAYVPTARDAEGPPPVPPNPAPPYAWERSWAATWTAVPVVLPPSTASLSGSGAGDGDAGGLSDGGKAGVAVAAALGVIGIAITGGVLLWRRRSHVADREGLTDLDAAGDGRHPVYYEMAAGGARARRESKGAESLAELTGVPRPQELNGESQKKAW